MDDDSQITILSDFPITILDDLQSEMNPNEIVNHVFMRESLERNIPINELIERKYN